MLLFPEKHIISDYRTNFFISFSVTIEECCLLFFFYPAEQSVDTRDNKRSKKENVGENKDRRKERDVSFICPHASALLVKEGRTTTGSPNLLSASLCFAIDFSDKVQNHFSTPLRPILLLSLTLFIISSHISACSLTHNPHGCWKSALGCGGLVHTYRSRRMEMPLTQA